MLLSLRKGGSKTSYTTSTTTTTTSRVDIETSIESILPRKTPFKLPKRTFPNQSILHKMTLIFLCCVGILILGLSTTRTVRALSSGSDDTAKNLISLAELSALVDDIRGDDLRLVRWDATKHTRRRQKEKSDNDNDLEPCPVALPKALQVIGYYGQQQVDTDTVWTDEQALQVALACEYATFCITDSPTNRALLSTYQIDPASPVENDNPVPPKTFTIHKAIVRVVQQTLYPKASAKAAHLIYIASFNNKINHRAFFRANAVAVLSQIIKSYSVVDSKTPSHKNDSTVSTTSSVTSEQAMWAAAALQNLAASYCSTENDGRCYWTWMSAMSSHAIIEEDSLPVLSDGTTVRRTALTDSDLLPALGAMVCQLGPVKGAMSTTNPYPGDNAVINQHEESPNGTSTNLLIHCRLTNIHSILVFVSLLSAL